MDEGHRSTKTKYRYQFDNKKSKQHCLRVYGMFDIPSENQHFQNISIYNHTYEAWIKMTKKILVSMVRKRLYNSSYRRKLIGQVDET